MDRPEDALEDAKDEQAEGDADQAIPRHRELGHRSPALENELVEGEPDLVAAVRYAWTAEVHPCRHRCARGKDRPEPTQALHIRQDVHQREEAQEAAHGGPGEPENPLLCTRPYRR